MTDNELRAILAAIIFSGGLATDRFSLGDALRKADILIGYTRRYGRAALPEHAQ